ncbi:hypothetical protein CQA57_01440 [Helicobacter anseris]|uniref:Autotransporter domain-containing protein n=1 Tax=Helicobacter anseris TaxID=375926 RepID=A0A3D8JAE1_9HELI|nr:hypothetical protein [Helicobacter anseris]RDU74402.1 hypothetical protein CQA57_01440 [Helicobacter anseris]
MKNNIALFYMITKTFIATSVAIIFYPQISSAADPINNTSEKDKQVIIGDSQNPNDSINGNIHTSGSGNSTTVSFTNNTFMQNGGISVANSGKNTINLRNNSFLNISGISANNGTNTITDFRNTNAPRSIITGNIDANSGGKNTLNSLKNFDLKGSVVAQGNSSANTITLQENSNILGYIASENSGTNSITLNGNARLETTITTTDSSSILASGSNSSNTITGNTSDAGNISGGIIAKDSGSNTITLSSLIVGGDTKASNGGKNTITLSNGGKLVSIIAEGSNGVTSSNIIILGGNASVTGFISSSTGGTNSITLNGNATLNLTNQGTNTNTAIYTSSSNTISGDSTGNHKILGDIIASSGTNAITLKNLTLNGNIEASSSATNTITLDSLDIAGNIISSTNSSNDITLKSLNMTGNITADGANNTIKISEDTSSQTSSIKGDITAQNTSSKNILEFYLTQIAGNITATSSGNNDIKLYGGGVSGKMLATVSGANAIELGNDTKQTAITGSIESDSSGSNTITLKNATISQGIIANDNGENTITITSTEDSNSSSDIIANASGKNTITFEGSALKGNILANAGGNNTISDNTSASKLIGSLIADSGNNELTASNLEITQKILAQNNGRNEIKAINTLLKSNSIEAQNGNNTINATGGVLESTLIQAKGDGSSSNAITLENSSIIKINSTNIAILASDNTNSKNTITDNTAGGTDNEITGDINALDNGVNEITLKKITMNGDIFAKNHGRNTVNFGNTALSNMNGNIIADTATNTLIFNNLNFIGSIQALSDSSTNTLNFTTGSFEGYLVAIGDSAESKNNLTLDGVTVYLKGTQIKNKDNQDIGTGKDAIYTQGENAKNIISDKTSNSWKIEGNITSFNGGKNTYDFQNKLEMTGSLSASLNNASNDITLNANSFIKDGYIKAQGDEVSNKVTAKSNAKLENLYLEVIAQNTTSQNEIILNDTSTMTLIANQETQNAIFAKNAQASNTISGDSASANIITGNILAQSGTNTITLKTLDITGDILTENEGANTINIQNSANSSKSNQIIGDIKATTGSNILNITQTTLTSKTIIADGKMSNNNINFAQNSSFSITNSDSTYALFANKEGAKNLITQTLDASSPSSGNTTGTISGNIIAQDSGSNTISKIKTLEIQNGYIKADGRDSKNDIQLDNLTLQLIASNTNDAILANGNGSSNTLIEQSNSSIKNSTITGNIQSNNGGKNIITLSNLTLSGNIIANKSGFNTIVLGDENTSNQNSSILGSIFANEVASKNTITLNALTQITLEKSTQGDNALLASGENAKNTLSGKSADTSSINADISAIQGGENSLTLDSMSIAGNILALDAGKNTFKFQKSSNISFGKMEANGTSAINTLTSEAVSALSGLLLASNGGENNVRVTLKNFVTKPLVDITTETSSKNILVIQGTSSAQSQINYYGGNTSIIFSESSDVTNDADTTIDSNDYKNGIMLTLDSTKANAILKDFRDISYLKNNQTVVTMENKNNLLISGIYIGKIDFLQTANLNPSVNAKTQDSIIITLQKNSALISRINTNGNGNINLNLEQGSKWIVTPNNASRIQVDSVSASSSIGIDINEASLSTLAQSNTIIDIATGGYASKYAISKDNFTNLVIANASKLDGVIFRFYADPINNKSDTITISNVADANSATTKAILQAYYTKGSLENASKYNQRVLVATVESNAKDNFAFDISKPTTVEQGYTTITTEFEKKTEKKNSSSSQEVDNYYIKSYNKSLTSEATQNSYGILGVNYLVFLANTNNINKRLGEKRNEDYSDSFWIRSYGGQITQNIGTQVTNNYISTQGGYDFGFGSQESMHFIGIALSYGLNFIDSSLWKMQSQILSGALYYSYIRNSGIYTDTIFKYDRIDTTPKAQDLNDNIKNNAFSLTQEIGYRLFLDQNQKLFLDFQLEGIAGYLTNLQILQKIQNEQLLSQVNNFLVFRGRVGSVFAYRLKTSGTQTDFRIGASYIGDYSMAKFELDSNGATSSMNMPYNQMISANIGINSYITKKLRFYIEGEMGFMGKTINQNYAANLGLRYSFGTTKKEDIDSDIQQEKKIESEFKTINIEASKIRCNGCNPESGFYIEIIALPSINASLNNYFSKFSYRIHTQSNGTTYYFGPYKTLQEAKNQQDFANKIKQSLTKNPNATSEIFKINNKAKN